MRVPGSQTQDREDVDSRTRYKRERGEENEVGIEVCKFARKRIS